MKPLHYKRLVEAFEKDGWKYQRIRGHHMIFTKNGFLRPVVIPKYKTVPVFIIKNNLRTAKISSEEFMKLLKRKL